MISICPATLLSAVGTEELGRCRAELGGRLLGALVGLVEHGDTGELREQHGVELETSLELDRLAAGAADPAGSVPAGSVPAGSVPAGSVPAGSVPGTVVSPDAPASPPPAARATAAKIAPNCVMFAHVSSFRTVVSGGGPPLVVRLEITTPTRSSTPAGRGRAPSGP